MQSETGREEKGREEQGTGGGGGRVEERRPLGR